MRQPPAADVRSTERSEVLEVAARRETPKRNHAGGSGAPSRHSSAGIQCETPIPLIESQTDPSSDGLTYQSWKLARYMIGPVVKKTFWPGLGRRSVGAIHMGRL